MGCTVSECSGVATSTTAPERGCSRLLGSDTSAATVAAALQRMKRSAITLALKPKDAVLLAMARTTALPKASSRTVGRARDQRNNAIVVSGWRCGFRGHRSRSRHRLAARRGSRSQRSRSRLWRRTSRSTAWSKARRWLGERASRLAGAPEEKQHASTKVALAASEAARAKMEMKSAVTKAELKTVQVRATSATTAVQREHKKRFGTRA